MLKRLPNSRRRPFSWLVQLGVCAIVTTGPGRAQNLVFASPDVTVELGAQTFADQGVAADYLPGIISVRSLGSLPENVEVTAYHEEPNGERLFALDSAAQLAGPLTVSRGDVVHFDGVGYALEFDASAAGVPEGAEVDAVGVTSGGDLLLSFDTTVDLGGGVIAADEDLVDWNGASFGLAFDASADDVPAALDLDAVHDLGGGALAVSFDASGRLGTTDFADEDVMLLDPAGSCISPGPGGCWSLFYDASARDADWEAADLGAVALPEPRAIASLVAGIVCLIGLRRRRPSGGRS